jgi:uncharacterized OsmC-like protein
MSTQTVINGVDVAALSETVDDLKKQPELGKFKFRVENKWIDGGRNRTIVKQFYGAGEEHPRPRQFELEADEPPVLLGRDEAPNPVEHLLNALVGCLTSSMVYHAAARGVHIDEIESMVEGDIDTRGFIGIAPDVRKGYQNIRVSFRVKSDAPKEVLEDCARFSPVFDTITRGTNVDLRINKK